MSLPAILQLKRVIEADENFATAYGWLYLAYEMIMLHVEPAFDILHNDPRFDELVRRVGLK